MGRRRRARRASRDEWPRRSTRRARSGDVDADQTDARVRYLVDLWSELLGTQVEPGDNFFDLGGNSMLGVQMAERVARDTGLRIKLVRLAAQDLDEIAADLPASFDQQRSGWARQPPAFATSSACSARPVADTPR